MNEKLKAANTRAVNLLGTSIVGLAGFAFAPEAHLEDGLKRVDDGLLFLVGLLAIYWYNRAQNRYRQTIAPILFPLAGVAIKLAAIFIEIKDKEDVGDDFGGLILFVLATLLIWWLYRRNQSRTE